MKKLSFLCAIFTLAGCAQVNQGLQATNLVLQKVNDNLANIQRNSPLASAIIEFERLNPEKTYVCLGLPWYSYAKNLKVINNGAYNAEEERYRWERLSELGLAKKNDVKATSFSLSQNGKNSFSDISCSMKVGPYSVKVADPALLYGKLEFNRFITINENKYNKGVYNVAYLRTFTRIDEWAKDKELRRRWGLQGVSEIESMKWTATIKVNSNGASLIMPPHSYD